MSDIVDTSPLGIERTERIAGDDALNSKLDIVTTELRGTQESVTTEVLHRSEGDLVIQRILEGYIQDLLEGKSEDFERYIEFQNSQNLNYADVRNFVSSIRTALADEIRNLSDSLMTNLQANDTRYNKLVSDVDRYLEILSDITLDSNQITLDNGELRAGAWTILSQARQWDLDIINRLNGLTASVGESLKDAVEDIQNQLPSTEETITKAIEELSNSPIIKNLSDLLNQSIENDTAYQNELLEQARQHANDMAQLAEDMRAEALAKAQAMEDYMAGEVTARITEVNKEVAARKEAINLVTQDMLARADEDKATFQADMLTVTNRIKSAEDGLTSEIQHRKDGDSSTLNALNTYKVSNDAAITGLSTSLSSNVTKTNANTTLITGLTSRIDTAESDIESATTAAADAMSKATTAVSANSALSLRVDALAASITESEGTVVDVNAFNALKAEVNTVKGVVTGLVEDVTALESNYTTVNNKVTSQGTAISTLNTKMATAENSISQSANDITLLKTDISTINSGLLTKVDSQAFSQLSSDVSELDGKYTTQAGLVTDLRGSLDTTNVNVASAASAAQNALNTAGSKGKVIFGTSAPDVADRLSQNLWIDTTGSANTPKRWNGSAWVVVTDKVAADALAAANAATNLANTKADTTAFNSLDQKVTAVDGKVSTNTNSITSLNGKVAVVENSLTTKLDSSAIVNYYTKQQADDKALTTAAGEISKYDASLVIGGTNLYRGARGAEWLDLAYGTGYYSVIYFGVLLDRTKKYTVSFEAERLSGAPVRAVLALSKGPNQDAHMELAYHYVDITAGKHSITVDMSKLVITGTFPEGTPVYLMMRLRNERVAANIRIRYIQVEEGSKATTWSPSPEDVQSSLVANATAINTTNTEVARVDGKTTVNANNISGLTSRMGAVEGQVSTKAEATALQNYYTKTEATENATTVAAGEVAKYNASLKIGSKNLLTSEKWKTPALSSVNKATGYEFTLADNTSPYTGAWGMFGTWADLELGTQYVFSFKIKALDSTPLNVGGHIRGISNTGADAVYLNGIKVAGAAFYGGTPVVIPNDGKYHLVVVLMTKNIGGVDSIYIQPNRLSSYTQPYNCSVKEVMLTEGNAYSQWVAPDEFIQGQLDANATAITNTNSEVARVDGRVTTESNRITTLSGRVDTVQNGLALKADVSALNNIYTKSETDAKATSLAAGEVSKYDANLVIGGANTYHKDNASVYRLTGTPTFVKNHAESPNGFMLQGDSTANSSIRIGGVITSNGWWTVSFYVRGIQSAAVGFDVDIMDGPSTSVRTTSDNKWTYFEHTQKVASHNSATGMHFIDFSSISYATMYIKDIKVERGSKATAWTPHQNVIDAALEANAEALISTNAEVKRINEQVISHADHILNLTSGIAGKADASALNNIYTKAQTDAKVESVAAGKVEEYKSALVIGGSNQLLNSEAQRVGGNEYLMYESSAHLKQFYDDNLGKDITISFEMMVPVAGYVQVYSSNASAHSFNISTPWLAANTWTKVAVTVKPTRKSDYDAQARSTLEFYGTYNTGRKTYVRKVKLEKGNVATDWSPSFRDQPDMSGYATASAVQTLTTEVARVNGVAKTAAESTVTLKSRMDGAENALQIQAKVVDGVKASYMVKMETNGVIGGFGLMQSTGVLGQVITSFGVNANSFFIGAPASKKQPFIVTTTNQVVNGVAYPAGTYIDVALIANATIGTAKIANLAVTGAKIANATIDNAKIANLDAAKINTGTLNAARIGANSITATHIKVDNLSAVSATIGVLRTATSGARTEIRDNLITVFDSSNRARVKIGVF